MLHLSVSRSVTVVADYHHHHHHHHHHHWISRFSALAGKYSPILGCSK